jgi:hypothetical protein
LIVSLFVFCLLSSPLQAEDAPKAEPSESAGEADVQKALREKALKYEIEMARVRREGMEVVYKTYVESTFNLAEKANQTKSLSDVLNFKTMATETIKHFREMTETRVRQEWPKMSASERGNETMQGLVERQVYYEKKKIEGFLDESLRGK